MLGPPLLLDPGRGYMEDRNTISLGVKEDTLSFHFITLCLLNIRTPFIVLRDKHSCRRRFGSEGELDKESTRMMIISFS